MNLVTRAVEKMGSNSKRSNKKNRSQRIRKILYTEQEIEKLKENFGLSKDAENSAILIYRVLVGLGKGLSSSKKKSYSAISVWFAAKLVDGDKILKEDLADAVGLSPRTLSRRFRDVENNEKSKEILDFMKDKIKKWNRKKERRIQDIL